jgi:hypothetical protein
MAIRTDVLERLLLGKAFLDRIRFDPTADPDNRALATRIVSAHDAAELVLAAVAHQLNASLPKNKCYLMDYFRPIRDVMHPERDVLGKDYCGQLNNVRTNIKHLGIFPNPKQWGGVGEKVYGLVSTWCSEYLGVSLENLDLSELLTDPTVKKYVDSAKQAMKEQGFKDVLIQLAKAMYFLFKGNPALLNVIVGIPNAEDAIKLTGFGVHANDFLTLQQFLPRVTLRARNPECEWDQGEFGHPGNWRRDAAEFCLRTFVDLALKIQDAEKRPTPIPFGLVYRHKITALCDGVKVWRMPLGSALPGGRARPNQPGFAEDRKVWKTLDKGQSLLGYVWRPDRVKESLPGFVSSGELVVDIGFLEIAAVAKKDVNVKCVPSVGAWQVIPTVNLPEIDWEPQGFGRRKFHLGPKRRKKNPFPQHARTPGTDS